MPKPEQTNRHAYGNKRRERYSRRRRVEQGGLLGRREAKGRQARLGEASQREGASRDADDVPQAPARGGRPRPLAPPGERAHLSRGWMEFHPSSRHGSGTATRGYIPSSIASFIRDGSISQGTVLDRGTAGVHYALDW